jgi:hypothetical protein
MLLETPLSPSTNAVWLSSGMKLQARLSDIQLPKRWEKSVGGYCLEKTLSVTDTVAGTAL